MTSKLSEYMDAYFMGEPGKTLFEAPFPRKVTEPDDTFLMMQRIHNTQDQRAYVVVSALVAEAMVDKILALLLPSYKISEEHASRKIELLRAFRIVPKHLLDAADLLHRIRNKFAHNLEVSTFEELAVKFPNLVERLKTFVGQRGLNSKGSSDVALCFDDVSVVATAGINRYFENVRYYVELIHSPDFIDALAQRHQHEHREHLAMVVAALRQHQSAPITDTPN